MQSQQEHMPTARAMITHLQKLYDEQSRPMHFVLSKKFFNLKICKGQSVHDHYLTMIKDLKELQKFGLPMQKELQVNLILPFLMSLYS